MKNVLWSAAVERRMMVIDEKKPRIAAGELT
jgi:hypothetical protein